MDRAGDDGYWAIGVRPTISNSNLPEDAHTPSGQRSAVNKRYPILLTTALMSVLLRHMCHVHLACRYVHKHAGCTWAHRGP